MNRGGWMAVASGAKFWPFDPRAEDINIEDIAHALSHICRYGGHVRRFYSVAQHSVLVSHLVPEELALAALLHDAAEAYLGDIPRPIKYHPAMAEWRKAEAALEQVIAAKFCIPYPMHPAIKAIDDRIILDEWTALMPPTDDDIGVSGAPLGEDIRPWSSLVAGTIFLHRFAELTRVAP